VPPSTASPALDLAPLARRLRRAHFIAQFALASRLGPAPRAVHLPDDEGLRGAPIEWWYTVGQVGPPGQPRRHGFEVTFARVADPVRGRIGAWAAILCIMDRQTGRWTVTERDALGGVSRRGPDRLDLSIGPVDRAQSWRLAGGEGRYLLRAHDGHTGLDLTLHSALPAVCHGAEGRVTYAGVERLHWTSQTRLAVSGNVDDGVSSQPVEGLAWMDHQWGAARLDDHRWRLLFGWLSDGSELMAFRFEDAQGRILEHQSTRRRPDGGVDRLVSTDLSSITLTDEGPRWRGGRVDWQPGTRLQIPAWGLDLRAQPWALHQRKRSSKPFQRFPIWWEGHADLVGTHAGAPVTGAGLIEIAGHE
jgi:predicted secreted hydrolase